MNFARITRRQIALALTIPLMVTFFACSHADRPLTEASQASVTSDSALTSLAARFVETRRHRDEPASTSDWYFNRSENRIETARKDYSEIWERDEGHEITLKRVFHEDQKWIEYTPGLLRAERRIREWSLLASVIDIRTLARLENRGKTTILNQPAVRYSGKFGDEKIEIVWLTRHAIPAKIVRTGRDGAYILEMKELREAPDSFWPAANQEMLDHYEWLDGSDLGDREYDPFVRKVLSMDPGHPAGHTH